MESVVEWVDGDIEATSERLWGEEGLVGRVKGFTECDPEGDEVDVVCVWAGEEGVEGVKGVECGDSLEGVESADA